MTVRSRNSLAWIIGTLLALGAGYVHLVIADPALTALLVTMIAMGLSLVIPERPWRWAILCSIAVPLMQFAYVLRGERVQRGTWEGAFVLGLVSGVAGAFLGSIWRRVYRALTRSLQQPPPDDPTRAEEEEKRLTNHHLH